MFRSASLSLLALLAAAPAAHAGQIGDVFVIALENHNFTQPSTYTSTQAIFGNPAAPFINSLITAGNPNSVDVSYASNYANVPVQTASSRSGAGAVHPSEPNYIWSEAGQTAPNGVRTDADPSAAAKNILPASTPSLSAILQANGKTWTSYQEDTQLVTVGGKLTNTVKPSSQYTVPLTSLSGASSTYTNPYNGSHQYNYAPKHDPQVFFSATNGAGSAQNYAPLQALATNLANNTVSNYNFISPDQFNDMHSTLSGGFTYNGVHYTGDAASIAQGDNFLAQIVPLIEASAAFKNNGAIIIWNDETEGDGASTAGFTSTEIVISPLAKGNAYTNTIAYDHSSDLRSLQEIFGVDPSTGTPWIGAAANATDLSGLFQSGALTAVPETSSWAMMLAGFAGLGFVGLRRKRAAA
jgi:phospholipase C